MAKTASIPAIAAAADIIFGPCADSQLGFTSKLRTLAAEANVSFSWDINPLSIGKYLLLARASTVLGEANTANNSMTDPTVFLVRKTGGEDGKGVVTVDNVLLAAVA